MKKTTLQWFMLHFLLLLACGPAFAQADYSKVYFENEKALRSSSVVSTFDGSFIVSGTRESQNFFFKLDAAGEILWAKFLASPYSGSHSDIIALMDSTFLRISSFLEPDSLYAKTMLLNINGNGDTLWNRLINYDTAVIPFYVHQTFDSGFISTSNIRQPTLPNQVLYNTSVTKMDAAANLLWSKVYAEGEHSNQGKAIKQTPDSGYIVSGLLERDPPDYFNIFLMKLGSDGGIAWTKYYPFPVFTTGVWHDVVLLGDGFLVSAMDHTNLILMKTDLSGNVLWAKKYNTHSIDYRMHRIRIRQISDGSYVVLSPDNLMKMDGSGNIIWAKDLMMQLADFVEAPDKGFLIVGNGPLRGVKSPPSEEDHIGIVKTDSLGNNSSECISDITIAVEDYSMTAYPVSFTVEDVGSLSSVSIAFTSVNVTVEEGCVAFLSAVGEDAFEDNKLHVFPNPSNGKFTLQTANGKPLNGIAVYTALGELLIEKGGLETSEISLDLSGKPNGLYIIEIRLKDGGLSRKKILKK